MEKNDLLYKSGVALDKLERQIISQQNELDASSELRVVINNMLVYIVHLKYSVCKKYKDSEPRFEFDYIRFSKVLPDSVAVTELRLLSTLIDTIIEKTSSHETIIELNSLRNDLQPLLQYYKELAKDQQQTEN